mmetsp:Transcript_18805/g.23935  ORF Transcript_18805/g.23935 Transcript_18805/m.23935 type:complete len:90 (+) Transcript_18805:1701-1970(+)
MYLVNFLQSPRVTSLGFPTGFGVGFVTGMGFGVGFGVGFVTGTGFGVGKLVGKGVGAKVFPASVPKELQEPTTLEISAHTSLFRYRVLN